MFDKLDKIRTLLFTVDDILDGGRCEDRVRIKDAYNLIVIAEEILIDLVIDLEGGNDN